MDYLYHYTNLSSLALILSNKTIRFNSLCNVDDLQEQETEDIKNLGRFCFISSWTDDSSESIPMWNMYTEMASGVRIRLPKFPFEETKSVTEKDGKPIFKYGHIDDIASIIPVQKMLEYKFYTPGLQRQENILFEVQYTQDKKKLYPKIFSESLEGVELAFGNLGIYKNEGWKFQKEWRYKFLALPLDLSDEEHMEENLKVMVSDIISGKANLSFSHYDIPILTEAFSQMEIVLSPKMSEGNRLIVNNLVEKYNPTAKVYESVYKGKLA